MKTLTAFHGMVRLAAGPESDVLSAARHHVGAGAPVLIFDDETGRIVDLDLRPGADRETARSAPPPGRGRPKLGVTAREVTLLPRHWDWLAAQPGGASATLRRLVEAARRAPDDGTRRAQDATYRVMQALAGDLPGYEEALRALFAGDSAEFIARIAAWPPDLRDYAQRMAQGRPGEPLPHRAPLV